MAKEPYLIRRDKATRDSRESGVFYFGNITSVRQDGQVNIKIPSLGFNLGPILPLNSISLEKGDTVVCGFSDISNNSLIIFGRVNKKEFKYKVGDTGPGGGIIFFVDRNNEYADFTYLEAAPSSVEVARAWAPGSPVNYRFTEVDGANKRSLGGGYQNTIDIVNQGHINPATSAARYCADLSHGGQTDWYLPSIGELQLMCQELHVNRDAGSFIPTSSDYVYWSSTETAASDAFAMSFIDWLNLYPSPKGPGTYQVRPIRRF